MRTRSQVLSRFRARGWHGRMVWVPISLLAGGVMAASFVIALVKRERGGGRLAVWSILRSRHYNTALASTLLAAVREHSPAPQPAGRASAEPQVSRAYG